MNLNNNRLVKLMRMHLMNGFKKETDINKELSEEYFNFQRPSSMLKFLYKTNDREKNDELISIISSGLKDLKKKLKRCLKKKEKLKNQIR